MSTAKMQSLLVQFCNGASVSDLATFECLRRDSVEAVLRRALRELIHRQPTTPPVETHVQH